MIFALCEQTRRNARQSRQKIIFHLMDVIILIGYILFSSCGREVSHGKFHVSLVRDMLTQAGRGM